MAEPATDAIRIMDEITRDVPQNFERCVHTSNQLLAACDRIAALDRRLKGICEAHHKLCAICGSFACTIETCEAHPDAVQLDSGAWVCSRECFDTTEGRGDGGAAAAYAAKPLAERLKERRGSD